MSASPSCPQPPVSIAALIAAHGDSVWHNTRVLRSHLHHGNRPCPQPLPQLGHLPLTATCAECEELWMDTMILLARGSAQTVSPAQATSRMTDANRSQERDLHGLATRPQRDLRQSARFSGLRAQPELLELAVEYVLFLRSCDENPDPRALGRLELRCEPPTGFSIDQALARVEDIIREADLQWYRHNIEQPRSRRLASPQTPTVHRFDDGEESSVIDIVTLEEHGVDWTRGVRNETHLDNVLLSHTLGRVVAHRLRDAANRSHQPDADRLTYAVAADVAESLAVFASQPGTLDTILSLPISDPHSHLHTLVRRHRKVHGAATTTRQVMECVRQTLESALAPRPPQSVRPPSPTARPPRRSRVMPATAARHLSKN